MSNIVTALYNDTGRARTRPLYRYDYGQVLKIYGTTLPETYEVHFSNSVRDEAVTVTGNVNGVEVPDACLMDGRPVYAWLYMHTGEDDGETVFHITIPVIDRSCPSGVAPTPVERNIAQEALNKANEVKSTVDSHFPATGKFVAGTGSATANYAVAEGNGTTASGVAAHSEGVYSTASGNHSHAEGNSTASATAAHAEGIGSRATGVASHAEGVTCEEEVDGIIAETVTTASGEASHAEGMGTTASGKAAHSEGVKTVANHESQHVFGEYNKLDNSSAAATARGNYVEIVGNGTADSARSNARTLDWSGNEELAGDLTVNKGGANEASVSEIADDVSTLKSTSLTALQKQMLVDLFSSTANTGHASGDPVLAGTYVLKCDVATATGSRSMFTFKWVKES